jgi:hypothetical protein
MTRRASNEPTTKERKIWRVPVCVTSYIYDGEYRFYEAESADEALAKYNDENEAPLYVDGDGCYDTDYISEKVNGDVEEATSEQTKVVEEYTQ